MKDIKVGLNKWICEIHRFENSITLRWQVSQHNRQIQPRADQNAILHVRKCVCEQIVSHLTLKVTQISKVPRITKMLSQVLACYRATPVPETVLRTG